MGFRVYINRGGGSKEEWKLKRRRICPPFCLPLCNFCIFYIEVLEIVKLRKGFATSNYSQRSSIHLTPLSIDTTRMCAQGGKVDSSTGSIEGCMFSTTGGSSINITSHSGTACRICFQMERYE